MLNRDFDHLSTLLHLFFEREDICQKLNIIDQNNITGWEVWFQVEFANMLCSTDHEWWREQALSCDMRKKPERPTLDRKSTRLNSSHPTTSRMPSSA